MGGMKARVKEAGGVSLAVVQSPKEVRQLRLGLDEAARVASPVQSAQR